MLEARWPIFCPKEVRAKNINSAQAKPKQSIGVCVASVVSIHKLAISQEWLESTRQKILSGKAVINSKEPVWQGSFSPTEHDKKNFHKQMMSSFFFVQTEGITELQNFVWTDRCTISNNILDSVVTSESNMF